MGHRLGELAARFGLELHGDPEAQVERVATLANAGPGSLSFLANPAYRPQLAETRAAAVLLRPDDVEQCPTAALVAADPYLAYARIATLLHPPAPLNAGVHPAAFVAPDAELGEGCEIGPNACIDARAKLGERVFVGAGAVIGADVEIGADSRVLANATVMHGVRVGQRCTVHPGAVIGADGFGNARSDEGWVKVPQVGSVRIGDDVEIGANTTIDRGAIDDTIIENGVRLDNLIMVGHNVVIGEHTAVAAMAGISGSAVIGKRCLLAGRSGLVGHITICDDVVVAADSVITKNITKPGVYTASFPAEPDRDWKRRVARFRKLDDLARRVGRLEKGTRKE